MPKNIKPKKIIKALKELGFEETRITGSHHRFVHKNGRKTSVPIHGSEPIGRGLLNKIFKKDVGITKEEFEELLKQLILFWALIGIYKIYFFDCFALVDTFKYCCEYIFIIVMNNDL